MHTPVNVPEVKIGTPVLHAPDVTETGSKLSSALAGVINPADSVAVTKTNSNFIRTRGRCSRNAKLSMSLIPF